MGRLAINRDRVWEEAGIKFHETGISLTKMLLAWNYGWPQWIGNLHLGIWTMTKKLR